MLHLWEKLYILGKIKDDIKFNRDDLGNETDSENIESLENAIEDLEKLYIKIERIK